MALETGSYVNSLVVVNPASTDGLAQADDHLRLIKSTIKNTFPSITGAVTSTQAELNVLTGSSATTADLNKLNGVTSTAAEVNKLSGFTGTYEDLNYAKDLKATGVTSTVFNTGMTLLDGVTSTQAEINKLSGFSGTYEDLNKLDGYTGTTADLSVLNGISGTSVTSADLGHVAGVTSAIQTQMNTKAPLASPTFTGTLTAPTVSVTTVDLGQWTVKETLTVAPPGPGNFFSTLEFIYTSPTVGSSPVSKMSIDYNGNLTVVGDVTAFGTV